MSKLGRREFVGGAAAAGVLAMGGAAAAALASEASGEARGSGGADADEAQGDPTAAEVTEESLLDVVRSLQAEVHDLRAKQAIRDKLALYARGLDRQDPDIAKAAFAEDSHVDYGTSPDYGTVFQGSGWDWCDYCALTTDRDGITAMGAYYDHEWYQSTVTVNGDKAGSESYESAFVLSPAGDGTYVIMQSIARNCDKWECRDGDWVIVERVVTNDFGWTLPGATLSTPYGGTLDKDDPSYEALAYPEE